MGYLHLEVAAAGSAKRLGAMSGDVWTVTRDAAATTVILADGLGSGITAHIAATMTCSRLAELLKQGFSTRQAFLRVAQTMHAVRGTDQPYAVFTLLRMLSDGETTVLSYEMPVPLLISGRLANPLPQRVQLLEQEVVAESTCFLEPQEAIILVSDGISMAGLGTSLKLGWTMDGVKRFADDELLQGRGGELAASIHGEARRLWRQVRGDDCTVLMAACRAGKKLTVLTGPPADPSLDVETLRRFRCAEGKRVVAGATTARLVAGALGQKLAVESDSASLIAPPRYSIEGIELVTEGAVTLNQVFHILEENPDRFEADSGVSDLCHLLLEADRIDFIVGGAANPAHGDISFQQRGILPRRTIVPLLAEKLLARGKLVVIEYT